MARAIWIPPKALRDMIEEMRSRVDDWSPATERISKIMLEDTTEVFEHGLGEWAPLAPATIERWGAHPILRRIKRDVASPPLSQQNFRDWSKRNAAVINRAPHAHLMEEGTQRYSTPLWQQGGQRRSRASARQRRATGAGGATHVPPRLFLFVDDESYPQFEQIILTYIEEAVSGNSTIS